MTFVQQPDAGGQDSLRLLSLDGRLYPPFSPDIIKGVTSLDMRKDDILICAYPKAGTHWVWEIVRHLLAGTTGLPVVEKDGLMLECVQADVLADLPAPRVLNTHLWFGQLPAQVMEKGCKIIYINRNPKDLAVSCYHHHRKLTWHYQYGGSWENFLPLFMDGQLDYGSWSDYIKDWDQVPTRHPNLPIHCTTYEDLKESPVKETHRLAEFLGLTVDDAFVRAVVERCSFASMKTRKGGIEVSSEGEPIMYRKGEVGDWVNWFTVLQNEAMDGYLRQHLQDSGLKFKYTVPTTSTSNTNMPITDANMNVR